MLDGQEEKEQGKQRIMSGKRGKRDSRLEKKHNKKDLNNEMVQK